jgi:pilus assembly protein TadC
VTAWEGVAALALLDAALWTACVFPRTPTRASRRLGTYCAVGMGAASSAGRHRAAGDRGRPLRRWFAVRSAGRLANARALRKALPDALDTLALCLRAGLGLHAAVAEYAKTATGAAGDAFRGYLADLAVGRAPDDALEGLARRYPLDEVAAVAAAVAQSLRIGAPLADVFEAQAAHCRTVGLHRAREAAQKLSTQLVLPLVAFFFPVVFIIGLGPVALKIARLIGVLR